MGKVSNELKQKVVDARKSGKSYIWIERNLGVLRGTTFQWVNRYDKGTLFIDNRTKDNRMTETDDYAFLKKCLALLEKIRST